MECFYCTHGASSRCANSLLFGCEALDGGQAEYVRVPHADGTVVKAPAEMTGGTTATPSGNDDNDDGRALVLMADIFPTGFFGAKNAFGLLREQGLTLEGEAPVVVVVGCGPVGLCAIVSALEHRPRRLFAVDSVPARLERARQLGAEPLNFLPREQGGDGMETVLARVREATEGRGADAVIEVVGLSPALRTAFDLVRPFGVISSIGVHNAEVGSLALPHCAPTVFVDWLVRFLGAVTRRMGKYRIPLVLVHAGADRQQQELEVADGPLSCPVYLQRSTAGAGEKPSEVQVSRLRTLGQGTCANYNSFMFDKIMPLSEAVEGYELFDQMKVQKVIFKP